MMDSLMTATFWLTAGQTVVFLAVCGFAWWAARLIAEAADNSVQAAEQASRAARDAERTAAELRELQDALRTWLDQQRAHVGTREHQAPRGGASVGPVRTDTAEAHAVISPQAVISGGTDGEIPAEPPADASRSHRGRHARQTESPWTAALRAAGSRTSRDR
jgi:hypothetical protein